MKGFTQMLFAHPFATVWLATTGVLWLLVYLKTRTAPDAAPTPAPAPVKREPRVVAAAP